MANAELFMRRIKLIKDDLKVFKDCLQSQKSNLGRVEPINCIRPKTSFSSILIHCLPNKAKYDLSYKLFISLVRRMRRLTFTLETIFRRSVMFCPHEQTNRPCWMIQTHSERTEPAVQLFMTLNHQVCRRGSSINTDRFRISTKVWGHAPPEKCF